MSQFMDVRLAIPQVIGDDLVTEVKVGKMTGEARKKIADPKLTKNAGKTITVLLSTLCQMENGERMTEDVARKLNTRNRNLLFFFLRINTEGEAYTSGVTCRFCGHSWQNEDDLLQQPIEYSEDTIEEIEVLLKDGFVHDSDEAYRKFKLRLMTGEDEEKIGAMTSNVNVVEWSHSLITRCLLSMETDKGVKFDPDRMRGLGTRIPEKLITPDIDKLLNALNEDLPGLKSKRQVCCPRCGSVGNEILDISNFFSPA